MVRQVVSLDGDWLFRPDPRRIGELYPEELHYTHAAQARWCEPSHDIASWELIKVPGLWTRQGHADLECGWYRLDFAHAPHDGAVALVFDAVDYYADVWFNGHYLGSHEGCFGRFEFDVADLLTSENTLVVRVDSPCDVPGTGHEIGQMKRMFRGALERWDMNDPETKPAGIFGSVRLEESGHARLSQIGIVADPERLPPFGDGDAAVPVRGHIWVDLSIFRPCDLILRYRIRPLGFEGEETTGELCVTGFPGKRKLDLDFTLGSARLWWSWDLGAQRRYEVTVKAIVDGREADQLSCITGFRKIGLEAGWDMRLNGVRLYQRGANYLSDLDLSTMSEQRYRADLCLMREANLNTAHPFAVVEKDEFYALCDELGLVVYQDFPIWMMADTGSDVVRAAIRQFDDIHCRLCNNPSVVIWNFGSQPSVANLEKLCMALVRHARGADQARIAHLGNSAISYDAKDDVHPVRSFFWTEANAASFEQRYGWRRDCHMYPGWYLGSATDIGSLPKHHFGLVSEFGAQSLPSVATVRTFVADTRADIPWSDIASRGGQPELLKKHNPEVSSLEELVEQSQTYQADVLRHNIEFIRCRKTSGGCGLHLFAFNDCWPAVSWSIVEYDRTHKKAFEAVKTAMRPVQAFLHDYRLPFGTGKISTRITVVNDTISVLHDAVLTISSSVDRWAKTIQLGKISASGFEEKEAHIMIAEGLQSIRLELVWTTGSSLNTYRINGGCSAR